MGIIHETVVTDPFYNLNKRAGFFGLDERDEIVFHYLLNKDSEGTLDLFKISKQTGYPVDFLEKLTYDDFIPEFYVFQIIQLPIKVSYDDKPDEIIERPVLLTYNTCTQQYYWTSSFNYKKIDVLSFDFKNEFRETGDYKVNIDMTEFKTTKTDFTKKKMFRLFGKCENGEINKSVFHSQVMKTPIGHEPVVKQPVEVYEEIYNELREVIDHDEPSYYHFLTCFIIGSYFTEAMEFFPVLHISGPFSSGKTTVGRLIAQGSRYGYMAAKSTAANLAGKYGHFGPTGVFDESELEENIKIIKPFINAGSTKDATISKQKMVNGNWVSQDIDVYGLKVFVGINDNIFDETTESRTIPMKMKQRKKGVGRKPAFLVDKPFWKNVRDNLFLLRFQNYASFWKEYRKVASSIDRSGAERLESNFYFLLATASIFGEQIDEDSKFYKSKITGSLMNILNLTERYHKRKRYDPFVDALRGVLKDNYDSWVDQKIATTIIGTFVKARLTEWELYDVRVKFNYKSNITMGRKLNGQLDDWGFDNKRYTDREEATVRFLEKKIYSRLFGDELLGKEDENGNEKITDYIRIEPEELQARVDSLKTPSNLMKFFTELATANGGVLCMEAFHEGLEKTEGLNDVELEDVKEYAGELVDNLTERGLLHATDKEGEFKLKV